MAVDINIQERKTEIHEWSIKTKGVCMVPSCSRTCQGAPSGCTHKDGQILEAAAGAKFRWVKLATSVGPPSHITLIRRCQFLLIQKDVEIF